MPDTEYICLDTEFVNNITIIELSVYSIAARYTIDYSDRRAS